MNGCVWFLDMESMQLARDGGVGEARRWTKVIPLIMSKTCEGKFPLVNSGTLSNHSITKMFSFGSRVLRHDLSLFSLISIH